MKKQIISFIAAATIVMSIPFSAYAHSGRTDSSGGHKDNKNKSGLGYYHYHCGGHPAHLHENGVCPYSNTNSSSSYTFKNENASSVNKAEWIGDKYWTGDSFAKGWTKIGKKTYFFDSYGDKVTDWATDDDGNTYYFGTDGVLRTGWQKIGKSKYYFSSEGIMRTGLRKIDGKTYYFGDDGVMRKGKVKIKSKTYYFDSNGAMKKGWVQIGDYKYYFRNKDGSMVTGKLKIDGIVYEFDKNGRLIEQE